jgi:hypothetical protein
VTDWPRPFRVTDPYLDAPDGAQIVFERVGGSWEPIRTPDDYDLRLAELDVNALDEALDWFDVLEGQLTVAAIREAGSISNAKRRLFLSVYNAALPVSSASDREIAETRAALVHLAARVPGHGTCPVCEDAIALGYRLAEEASERIRKAIAE